MTTNSLERQVQQWAEVGLARLSIRDPVTIHLDQLLGKKLKEKEALAVSLQVFRILVEQVRRRGTPAQPGLVIPLVFHGTKLEADVPVDLHSLEIQIHHREPPSLYLLDWEALKYLEVCEEYKAPLRFHLIEPPSEGVYVYYREFRDAESIEHNWEFARCIYVEYYPEHYRL
jgi:hypothetical protein